MPAIFWTTDAAMVVLPCAVSSASRAGEPSAPVGAATVLVVVAVPAGIVILRFLLGSSWVVGGRTRAGRGTSRRLTRSGVAEQEGAVLLQCAHEPQRARRRPGGPHGDATRLARREHRGDGEAELVDEVGGHQVAEEPRAAFAQHAVQAAAPELVQHRGGGERV